jgi:hypothetical protein
MVNENLEPPCGCRGVVSGLLACGTRRRRRERLWRPATSTATAARSATIDTTAAEGDNTVFGPLGLLRARDRHRPPGARTSMPSTSAHSSRSPRSPVPSAACLSLPATTTSGPSSRARAMARSVGSTSWVSTSRRTTAALSSWRPAQRRERAAAGNGQLSSADGGRIVRLPQAERGVSVEILGTAPIDPHIAELWDPAT